MYAHRVDVSLTKGAEAVPSVDKSLTAQAQRGAEAAFDFRSDVLRAKYEQLVRCVYVYMMRSCEMLMVAESAPSYLGTSITPHCDPA